MGLPKMFKHKRKSQPDRSSNLDEVVEKKTDSLLRLISLQNADGSWTLNAAVTTALGLTENELMANATDQDVDPYVWATVLAIIWLYKTNADRWEEWELLEVKALTWIKAKAGVSLAGLVTAGNSLLKATVDPKVFRL